MFRTKLSNIEEYQKQSNNNLHKLTMKQFQILNSEYIKTKGGMFPKDIERPDIMIKETFVHDDLVWNQKRDDAVNNLQLLEKLQN